VTDPTPAQLNAFRAYVQCGSQKEAAFENLVTACRDCNYGKAARYTAPGA